MFLASLAALQNLLIKFLTVIIIIIIKVTKWSNRMKFLYKFKNILHAMISDREHSLIIYTEIIKKNIIEQNHICKRITALPLKKYTYINITTIPE